MPIIYHDVLEGGHKGDRVAQSSDNITRKFFKLGIARIEKECNLVSSKYRSLWKLRKSTDLMTEYNLGISYNDGCLELEPAFVLFEPASIHVNIVDSCYQGAPDVPANVSHTKDTALNPTLTIYLGALELAGSRIVWRGSATGLDTIIYHELLHACGDSPILRAEIHDGVIRHTLIPSEAIRNLSSIGS